MFIANTTPPNVCGWRLPDLSYWWWLQWLSWSEFFFNSTPHQLLLRHVRDNRDGTQYDTGVYNCECNTWSSQIFMNWKQQGTTKEGRDNLADDILMTFLLLKQLKLLAIGIGMVTPHYSAWLLYVNSFIYSMLGNSSKDNPPA